MLLLLLSVASSSVESVFGLCVNLFKLVRAYLDERSEKERARVGEVLVDIIPNRLIRMSSLSSIVAYVINFESM